MISKMISNIKHRKYAFKNRQNIVYKTQIKVDMQPMRIKCCLHGIWNQILRKSEHIYLIHTKCFSLNSTCIQFAIIFIVSQTYSSSVRFFLSRLSILDEISFSLFHLCQRWLMYTWNTFCNTKLNSYHWMAVFSEKIHFDTI